LHIVGTGTGSVGVPGALSSAADDDDLNLFLKLLNFRPAKSVGVGGAEGSSASDLPSLLLSLLNAELEPLSSECEGVTEFSSDDWNFFLKFLNLDPDLSEPLFIVFCSDSSNSNFDCCSPIVSKFRVMT
jgi:hypothetical protein